MELYGFECQYADCNNILNGVTSVDGVFVCTSKIRYMVCRNVLGDGNWIHVKTNVCVIYTFFVLFVITCIGHSLERNTIRFICETVHRQNAFEIHIFINLNVRSKLKQMQCDFFLSQI